MDSGSDVALLLRWCHLALESLGEARAEIDALNVFPVPDGDTGTNLYLTFEAAVAALDQTPPAHPAAALHALSRGALLGARGNSGVILSQLLRASAEPFGEPQALADDAAAGRTVAAALRQAAAAGYAAVGDPVEGTILTVARAAAEAAAAAAECDSSPRGVIVAAAAAAREALARTPEQLEPLRLAGVVDAGGRGLCVLLDAAETTLDGRRPPPTQPGLGRRSIPVPYAPNGCPPDVSGADGPAYEVMYLLSADDEGVAALRKSLAQQGDSLVVVGGDGLWNVHVHVDDAGAAVEAGVAAGTPHRIQVNPLIGPTSPRNREPRRPRAVVAITAGPGLEQLVTEGGGNPLPARPGRRNSTAEILDAIRAADAAEVVVLPNDRDTVAVAEAAARAARDEGLRVSVVPTRTQVQGLAALAVHEPGRSFDDDVIAMSAAAGQTRHGAVTVAARDAMTMAGPCREGDALGVIDGDFALVGSDVAEVAVGVVERLLAGGGELVTLVTGKEAPPSLATDVRERVLSRHPEVDTVVYPGGQPRYLLLLAVE